MFISIKMETNTDGCLIDYDLDFITHIKIEEETLNDGYSKYQNEFNNFLVKTQENIPEKTVTYNSSYEDIMPLNENDHNDNDDENNDVNIEITSQELLISIINKSPTNQILFNGTYFTLKKTLGPSIIATCMLCPIQTDIMGIYCSNFKQHIKKVHGNSILKEIYKNINNNDDNDEILSSGHDMDYKQNENHIDLKQLSLSNQILFDGRFFAFKGSTDRHMVAMCKLCIPNKKLKGTIRTSSDFLNHVKYNHGEDYIEEINEHIRSEKERLLEEQDNDDEDDDDDSDDSDDDDENKMKLESNPEYKKFASCRKKRFSYSDFRIYKGLTLTHQFLFDGKFFAFITMKRAHKNAAKVFMATCQFCKPHYDVKGSHIKRFQAHLKKYHGDSSVEELNEYIRIKTLELEGTVTNSDSFKASSTTRTSFTIENEETTENNLRSNLETHVETSNQRPGTSSNDDTNETKSQNYSANSNRSFKSKKKYTPDPSTSIKGKSREHLKRHAEKSVKEINDVGNENVGDVGTAASILPSHHDMQYQNRINLKKLSLPNQILFDGRFFTLKGLNGRHMIGICKLCKPNRELKGIIGNNSSFLGHVKMHHGKKYVEEMREHIRLEKEQLLEKKDNDEDDGDEDADNNPDKMENNNDEDDGDEDDDNNTDNMEFKSNPEYRQFASSRKSCAGYKDFVLYKSLTLTNQILFDGKFFAFKNIKKTHAKGSKVFKATCQFCKPHYDVKGIQMKDFQTHFKRYHGDSSVEELNEYIRINICVKLGGKNPHSFSVPFKTNSTTTSSINENEESENDLRSSVETHPESINQRGASNREREHLKRPVKEMNEYGYPKKSRLQKNNNNDDDDEEISEIQTNLLSSTTTTSYKTLNELQPTTMSTLAQAGFLLSSATSTPKTINTKLPPPLQTKEKLSNKQLLIFNNKIITFFLKSFSPLGAVATPEFWTMFDSGIPRISEEDLIKQIEEKFMWMRDKIIALLENIDFICITIDLWSSSSKSHYYLAVICHWIDAIDFKRKSVAIACKRFDKFENQTCTDVILEQILNDYHLPLNKITSKVTKNCYNFSQIFKNLNISTKAKSDAIDENHSLLFQTKHLICYTKTLSLIATIDIPNVIDSSSSLKLLNESTLKKVFAFLSVAQFFPKVSPMLKNLKKPDVTKWNSIYNSISFVLKLEEKLSFVKLFSMVHMEPFTDEEVKYLREYVKCLNPLAIAFERLQCEQGTYHGFVLPTLLEMRKKCEKLLESNDITLCQPILKTILINSMKRFEEYFKPSQKSELVTIASLSHPFFKEKWVSAIDELERKNVRKHFVEVVKTEASKVNNNNGEKDVQKPESGGDEEIDDFYFGEDDPKDMTKTKMAIELDALRYLGDKRRDLKMLDDYPAVKRVFLKYNTDLSSSEPFEKLFPYETREYIARYGKLADELFEERVLLNVNKDELAL
ncbi:uncharacterized protein LOC129905262 [Episyrphus balteatus]|uniref:uncharacterized protein LOC129905262 n=1 Tax=Episyrphus balteatus TaxID=286459 RepID=UPI0024863B6C|nr:uncharacterized protein LOC129905262 [Episyrphus balteatus]